MRVSLQNRDDRASCPIISACSGPLVLLCPANRVPKKPGLLAPTSHFATSPHRANLLCSFPNLSMDYLPERPRDVLGPCAGAQGLPGWTSVSCRGPEIFLLLMCFLAWLMCAHGCYTPNLLCHHLHLRGQTASWESRYDERGSLHPGHGHRPHAGVTPPAAP